MRHHDLRRPGGLWRFWLYLRLLALRMGIPRRTPTVLDPSRLTEHQLRDIGLERQAAAIEPAAFWRFTA